MAVNLDQAIPTSDPVRQREFRFTERDFQRLSALAGRLAGIHLTEAKRELVYGRLARRLRQLGLRTFSQYCELLDSGDQRELEKFTNAITTNLTSFFREAHHFYYLKNQLLPSWLESHSGSGERIFRVWCAGCSTGEEPYSLAMTIKERIGTVPGADFRIVATDLDSDVLATAARGVYPLDRVKDLDRGLLKRWFLKGRGDRSGFVKLNSEVQRHIQFRQHNMVFQDPPENGLFDAVFCRNVVIYFDRETQNQVFSKFADALRPEGHLFVGHSESLFKKTDRFKLVGQSTYQKRT